MRNPKERIIVSLILLIFIFALFSVIVSSTDEIRLSARSASLYEPETRSFLYEKNADIKLPMASTTKIMTALVVLENSLSTDKVTVGKNAVGVEGSSLYLKEGETLSVENLLYGLMLRSANDAGVALAEAIGGSIEGFADMMNARAEKIGLKSTHFTNPHGLDNKEHYTTAKELAIISAEALKNEKFKEIVSTYKKEIVNGDGEKRLVVNHNKLLKLYDGAIGVKTGFTKKSGRCLVGAAERNGLTFISVTIDAPNDWNDHEKLFDYGYSHMEKRVLAKFGDFSYKIPVIDGNKNEITVENKDEFYKIMNISDQEIHSFVKMSRYVCAPVKEGDILGKVVFKQGNKVIGEINLYALENVDKVKKHRLF